MNARPAAPSRLDTAPSAPSDSAPMNATLLKRKRRRPCLEAGAQ